MTFLEHVQDGLLKNPKKLSSRYFYDEVGDALFQRIMKLEEYYLPRFEMDIITNKSAQIATDIAKELKQIEVLELGAGDGTKTKHMLKAFMPHFDQVDYVAMDISNNILETNEAEVKGIIPDLKQTNYAGDYFETYKAVPKVEAGGRLVLFLGSNIGNYLVDDAAEFFKFVQSKLTSKDYLLVAFDLAKDPRKIIAAYDDREGVTKQFNLNLLTRINRELGANIDVSKFDHFPFYNPFTGVTSSQIISLEKQTINLESGFSVDIDAFEAIHTEVSKKYFPKDIRELAAKANMHIANEYFNATVEYVFTLFQPNA